MLRRTMASRSALEPALLALLDDNKGLQRQTSETLFVTVKFTGPVADLEAVGFGAWTVIPHPDNGSAIAAGAIPRNRLGDLADLPGVLYVEGSRPYRTELNHTVPEIQANLVHSGNPSRKGAGVVVGVIDSGIDIFHQCFRNPDGTTRVLGIWDQTLPVPLPGERRPAGSRSAWSTARPTSTPPSATPRIRCHSPPTPRECVPWTLMATAPTLRALLRVTDRRTGTVAAPESSSASRRSPTC